MSESKVCTIVGMGAGLSLGIAKRFAREGFSLGLIGRGESDLKGYAVELAGFGTKTQVVAADASRPEKLSQAIRRCHDTLGTSTVLVYNAAFWRDAPLLDLTAADLHEDFAVNVAGALTAAHAVVDGMRADGHGTMLFTGGGLALYQMPRMGALAIGKAGIRTLAKTLAQELAPEGIHVATITVCGAIRPDTYYSPDRIAEQFWQLHLDKPEGFRSEIVYSEKPLNIDLTYPAS